VKMQDVEVPVENRLGEEGEGFKIAMSCLDNGRYTVASGATGLIRACLEASLKYAHERETFGQPIATTSWSSRRSPTCSSGTTTPACCTCAPAG
jgi:alkylation response protein AidB-like acyl-CoA dehydrogenase